MPARAQSPDAFSSAVGARKTVDMGLDEEQSNDLVHRWDYNSGELGNLLGRLSERSEPQ